MMDDCRLLERGGLSPSRWLPSTSRRPARRTCGSERNPGSSGKIEESNRVRPVKILIVKLSAIGDVVHSLPFLEVLWKGLPEARIDWLVEEGAFQLIEGHPAVHRIIVSRRKSWQRKLTKKAHPLSVLRELCAFLKDLRSTDYDLVIDLQGLLKSGVLVGLSKGKRKIGMNGSREGAGLFLNERPIPVN